MTGGAGTPCVALATLLLLCCPARVAGQQNQGRPDQRVSARASVLYKVTRLAGGTHFLVGARAAVVFAGGLEIGGAGIKLIESVDISLGPGNMLELRTGYGGITLSKTSLLGGPVGAGILLGAGNAEVRSPPVGNQLGSDNFFVFEPELTLALPSWKAVRSSLGVGVRLVVGVDDLPNVRARDLRGFTATLAVGLGGR